ncbi:DUF2264 domain-containing protein [Joostella atrarenae]|uniref:DUF2264 domain-containing protein n=1 Tax=Joostella atrarenae TaxID=679257 RepID=A0ABS9J5C4_9FLAO|nr:DUF2264 domain-containing protein [Joostella atrarenae]MCF8715613.1 DUF2264 domain-containing protein [Joostella atrarenae]
MKRRNFINTVPLIAVPLVSNPLSWFTDNNEVDESVSDNSVRSYWVDTLYKISHPVLYNLANNTLVKNMPNEKAPSYGLRKNVTYLEAFGRTMAGLAPWLGLPDDDSAEGKKREELKELYYKAVKNGVNPSSPDYLNFRTEHQPIVDAAFLAQGLLRAPKALWDPLDNTTKKRLITEFKALRTRKAFNNNWLIFTATTEAFLRYAGEDDWDKESIDKAISSFKEWYVGDGNYSDGPHFAFDYYNSYVMHPMFVEVLEVMKDFDNSYEEDYNTAVKRMVRYAELQERMISPEGTFPVIGRSITYRTAAFQVLAMAAQRDILPEIVSPAQVRCALTEITKNLLVDDVFDDNDWLLLGFRGHQPEIADYYTSTGSLYMTTLSFLPLGLPSDHEFWSAEDEEWTSKKAWQGKSVKKDYKVKY